MATQTNDIDAVIAALRAVLQEAEHSSGATDKNRQSLDRAIAGCLVGPVAAAVLAR